ncbi:MAG: helix-turn-helix transcriptional regulator [Phycisphaerales bacterium]|nr:helix-turn-helix transcriptional regulator [Phycisphaerales bacterium]
MGRLATTADVFAAIAEPKRREIIEVLARQGAMAVNAIVHTLKLAQPAVSKHLAVLKEVGVVSSSKRGRQRVYRLRGEELKAVHDWVKMYEQFWSHQLNSIRARAEHAAREQAANSKKDES